MICEECGDEDTVEGAGFCSYCLEVPLESAIVVRLRPMTAGGDWAMECWTHDERGTFSTWQDAYEAALGHACMSHHKVSVCRRKGHDWERKYPGRRSDLYSCRRCGEPGWQIFEDLGPVAVDQSWADVS